MRNLTQYLEQLVASGTQPGELAVIPAAGPAPSGSSWTGELSWVGGDDQG